MTRKFTCAICGGKVYFEGKAEDAIAQHWWNNHRKTWKRTNRKKYAPTSMEGSIIQRVGIKSKRKRKRR